MDLITQRARGLVDALPMPPFKLFSSLKRFARRRNLVFVGLTAAICFVLPPLATITASAGSCQVKDGEVSNFIVSLVYDFGDLKVRVSSNHPAPYPAEDWALIDLKAPGFLKTDLRFDRGQAQRFQICGQDVTILYEDSYYVSGTHLHVSVF